MSSNSNERDAYIKKLERENSQLRSALTMAQVWDQAVTDQRFDYIELLESVLALSDVAFTIWDTSSNQRGYISKQLGRVLGYVDIINTPSHVRALIHPEDKLKVLTFWQSKISPDERFEVECRLLHADGQYRWFMVKQQALRWNENNTPRLVVASVTDINPLKIIQVQAEVRRERSEWLRKITSTVFEHGDLAAIQWALGEIAKKFEGNRVYLRMKEQQSDRFTLVAEWYEPGLQPFLDVVPHEHEMMMQLSLSKMLPDNGVLFRDQRDAVTERMREIRRALDTHQAVLVPLVYGQRIQGCLSLMSDHSLPWDSELQQMVVEIAHVISLVFYRKTMADDLLASDLRFQYAVQVSHDGLWDYNILTREHYISPSFYAILGYNQDKEALLLAPSTFFASTLDVNDRPRMRQTISEFFAGSEIYCQIEFRSRHRDGHVVWIVLRAQKVAFDQSGNATRIVGVHTDITAHKKALARLEQAQVEAQQASLTKSEFLARMSHEIRTPMNAILGMAHLALQSDLDEVQAGFVRQIDESAHSLLTIIDDILDFSKIEAGKLELENARVELLPLVTHLANLFTLNVEQKNIDLVFDVATHVPAVFMGDPTRLRQVLINLIANAIKFTDKGGVYISINFDADKKLIVQVSDTGIGIDAAVQKQLFSPFHQADESVTRRFGGTGLGLSISKNLIEMMGGSIRLDSTVGIGSVFTFSVPLTLADSHPPLQLPVERVWIVDRNSHTAIAATHGLQRFSVQSVVLDNVPIAPVFMSSSVIAFPTMMPDVGKTTELMAEGAAPVVILDDRTVSLIELRQVVAQYQQASPSPMFVYVTTLHQRELIAKQILAGVVVCNRPLTPEKLLGILSVGGAAVAENETEEGKDQRWGSLQNKRVLLAEDNVVNQKVASGVLRKRGVDVFIANDGLEALALLHEHGGSFFDAVLMDMEMPRMDGYQATQAIRRDPNLQDICVIAMTAHAMVGDREKCFAAGVDDYISKPIKPALLYEMLATRTEKNSQ